MKKIIFLLLALLRYSVSPAVAQEAVARNRDHAILYFVAKDSVGHPMIGYFYSLQGPLRSDPVPPRFIVASRDQNVALGIGGYVRLRGSYDFRGVCNSEDFHAFDINVPNAGNPSQELQMNAGSSRLFMRLIANTRRLGILNAYVEADFLGANRAFRLRQAYISFRGFTFGQTLSYYVDGRAYAPSMDQNGGIAALNQRNPMIGYTHTFAKGFKIGISAELPPFTGTYQAGVTNRADAQVPDIPFYVQYGWKGNHVRFTGLFRDLPYKNEVSDSYHRVAGYGAKLSGLLRILPALDGMFYTSYGKGMATYSLDLSGAGMDLIPDYERPGKMITPRTAVYYGGFRINFSRKFTGGLTYSYIRMYSPSEFHTVADTDAQSYKYGQSATACLIWNFFPSASCGIEYLWGQRTNYDTSKGHANRIYASIRYDF